MSFLMSANHVLHMFLMSANHVLHMPLSSSRSSVIDQLAQLDDQPIGPPVAFGNHTAAKQIRSGRPELSHPMQLRLISHICTFWFRAQRAIVRSTVF